MRFALASLFLLIILVCGGYAIESSPYTPSGNAQKASPIKIDFYYGIGCPHCAATEKILEKLSAEYELNITKYEVYQNAENRQRMFKEYERFNVSISKGGVPTSVVQGKAFVVGELTEEQWRELFDAACKEETCPIGVITQKNFNIIHEKDSASTLTWPVLIGAALVDSINPCTIAIMVMLISTILYSKGRKEALVAGLLFAATIFVMYFLYGIGIMKVVTTLEISHIFYALVTFAALVLAIMEFNAYINYKPGFFAVEMPLWLRPHAHAIIEKATTNWGVALAAVFCSLFLLPCSSGPYLMVLGLIAKSATLQTLTYLVVYNLFFVLPMVAITLLIYFGKTTIESVGEMKEKYIRQIHLVSGIILLLLFIVMLNELLKAA
ncbi:MAG: hypothetical protein N3G76_00740 [Candidatus Micrarchaeota archaeon]|nr:hypothetical protein [Candidatus Micrarchaeota archaeon]